MSFTAIDHRICARRRSANVIIRVSLGPAGPERRRQSSFRSSWRPRVGHGHGSRPAAGPRKLEFKRQPGPAAGSPPGPQWSGSLAGSSAGRHRAGGAPGRPEGYGHGGTKFRVAGGPGPGPTAHCERGDINPQNVSSGMKVIHCVLARRDRRPVLVGRRRRRLQMLSAVPVTS